MSAETAALLAAATVASEMAGLGNTFSDCIVIVSMWMKLLWESLGFIKSSRSLCLNLLVFCCEEEAETELTKSRFGWITGEELAEGGDVRLAAVEF